MSGVACIAIGVAMWCIAYLTPMQGTAGALLFMFLGGLLFGSGLVQVMFQ
jgi:hypothetical protein